MTATFSDAYLKFMNIYNQLQVREEDHTIKVPEKVIRSIWNDQLFCTPSLKTKDDQNLEIVYSGYWNFGKGPDFTSATIKVTGFHKLIPIWKSYQDRVPTSSLKKEDWSFRAIRPANYPYRRLAGLAHLIVRHEKEGMFANFIGAYQKILTSSNQEVPDKKTLNSSNDIFCLAADDYWANHYTPNGKTLAQPQQLIGSARSREIIINIGLSIGLIFSRAGKFKELETGLNALF